MFYVEKHIILNLLLLCICIMFCVIVVCKDRVLL